MQSRKRRQGFTLIEILLVVVIIGIMLAVIVPRAWRANVDSKYGLVRQAATEAASFGNKWAEQELMSQDDDSTASLNTYYNYLCDGPGGGVAWLAHTYASEGWKTASSITGRTVSGTTNSPPKAIPMNLVPPEKVIKNPFSGTSVFAPNNDPMTNGGAIPGALCSSFAADGIYNYYAIVFQGTDNTGSGATDMHAGMAALDLEGLRNGVFMGRLR